MDKKQLAAIVSARGWDDLNRELTRCDNIEMLSPLQNVGDLKRARSRELLDVVFVDFDEYDVSSNGNGTLLAALGPYVVFIADSDNPENIRIAMRAGAKDYLVRPFTSSDLSEVFKRAADVQKLPAGASDVNPAPDAGDAKESKIFTFFATKGGVGKSALASNFALALSQLDKSKKVCLLDLDLQFGDLALILNVKPRATISDLISAGGAEGDDILSYLSSFNENLSLLSAPARPEEAELIGAETVGKIIDAISRRFDYLVIDTAASFHDISLSALDKSHEIFLIVTPLILAVKNLKSSIDVMLNSLEYPADKLKVVLNRSDSKAGISKEDIEKLCNIKIKYNIPSDGNIVVPSLNTGAPAVAASPKSKFSRAILEMALTTAGTETKRESRVSFWNKLFRSGTSK
ncbi:MAG: AAA family ATPase [bacterium]